MRTFLILAGVLAAVFAATPAAADPAQPVGDGDIVVVGANTTQYVGDDLVEAYNATATGALYDSWDAVNPATGASHDFIAIHPGVGMIRPAGTNEALKPWETGTPTKVDAVFADRDLIPVTDDGLAFLPFAQDTIGYATSAPTPSVDYAPRSNAPTNLTAAQLELIYTCQATTWNDPRIGGTSPNTIHPLLPPPSSGITNEFQSAMQANPVTGCVTIENDNDPAPISKDADAIEPFSQARYTTVDSDAGIGFNTSSFHYAHDVYTAIVIDSTGNIPLRLQPLFGDGYGDATATSNWICGAQGQSIIFADGFTALPPDTICGLALTYP